MTVGFRWKRPKVHFWSYGRLTNQSLSFSLQRITRCIAFPQGNDGNFPSDQWHFHDLAPKPYGKGSSRFAKGDFSGSYPSYTYFTSAPFAWVTKDLNLPARFGRSPLGNEPVSLRTIAQHATLTVRRRPRRSAILDFCFTTGHKPEVLSFVTCESAPLQNVLCML